MPMFTPIGAQEIFFNEQTTIQHSVTGSSCLCFNHRRLSSGYRTKMPQGEGMDYLRFLAVSRSQEEGTWPSEVPGEGESQKPTGVLSWNGNWCEESGIGDPATLISKNVLGKSPELSENLDAKGQWRCLSFTCPVPWFRFPLVPTQDFHSAPAVCQALGTQWRTR